MKDEKLNKDNSIMLGKDGRTLEQLVLCLDEEQRDLLKRLSKVVTAEREMSLVRIYETVKVFYLTEEKVLNIWYEKCINEMNSGLNELLEDMKDILY